MTSPDKIRSAIDHIRTSVDVDPWAMKIAIDAMEKQIPRKPMKSVDTLNANLYKLYCPECGALVAVGNSRSGYMTKMSEEECERCCACGQKIDWEE